MPTHVIEFAGKTPADIKPEKPCEFDAALSVYSGLPYISGAKVHIDGHLCSHLAVEDDRRVAAMTSSGFLTVLFAKTAILRSNFRLT
jgi:hypothetical protein